jgi:protein-ribulosamine 3-kinase
MPTITFAIQSEPSLTKYVYCIMSVDVHAALDFGKTSIEALSEVEGDFPLDQSLIAEFPPGSRIVNVNRFGTSAWTTIARLSVEHPDGGVKLYFLKCALNETGRYMMEGEFNAMSELYQTMPEFIPKPYSWGKYHIEQPETYFFLSEFINMSHGMPDPNQLCSKLAQLHRKSVSPTGKFGFHVTTCQGNTPQQVSWESSWAIFFSKLLTHVLNLDVETNGTWEDFNTLARRAIESVIPRLIGAVETQGRTIKPCLIHADLWEGNTGTSYETGSIYLFDSAAFYAHNEMEIGDWRCHYNKIHNKVYTQTYLRHFAPSEPREEWDDRNRMYSVYYNVIYSVNHKGQGTAVRQT